VSRVTCCSMARATALISTSETGGISAGTCRTCSMRLGSVISAKRTSPRSRSIIRLHLYLRSQRSFMVILREDTLHLAANIAIFSSPSRLICGIIYFLHPQAEDLVYVCEVLSRRFSCIMLLRLLLLHTVRMTWRIFLCFLTRGLSREYLCE
jgi:hypothetical protein